MRTKFKATSMNNKGIAMITIIIAVAFVSVIGSALLYISYMNFQMKVLNLNSKTNYYETDGELMKVTAGIRNAINTPTDIEALLPGLVQDGTDTSLYTTSTVKLEGVDGILGKSGILNSGTERVDANHDKYIYSVGGAEKRAVSDTLTTYTIKNLMIKQISSDGYSNSVKTNLEIKVLKQTGGSGGKKGLGECSMLSDCPVEVDANNFSFLTLLGDSFFASYNYGSSGNEFGTFPGDTGTGSYTKPGVYGSGKPGLLVQSEGKINLESDYLVVYGDLVLKDKACLNINKGNLTVYGDIYILDSALLVCSGEIYMAEHALPGRGEPSCFKSGIGVKATKDYLKKHLYYGGSFDDAPYVGKKVSDDSFKGFCATLDLNNADKDDDGVAKKLCKKFKIKSTDSNEYSIFDFTNEPTTSISTSYYGENCGVAFFKGGADVGNLSQWTNYICFIAKGNGGTTSVKASNVTSTFVSVTPIKFDVQSGVYLSKLGSNMMNYLTIPHDQTTAAYYDESIHNFELNWNGKMPGITTDAAGKGKFSAGDFLQDTKDATIQNMWSQSVNSSGGTTVTYINSALFKDYVKDID